MKRFLAWIHHITARWCSDTATYERCACWDGGMDWAQDTVAEWHQPERLER